ncbi:N-acetylneuraminate synthase family protein [Candidatus Methylomirabilis sp.]|uniref:N-acetylneuraminate synthase family protein n=1 Tax=Candidatus Methylomirabilis sp. TaxID=2032687 RepID=UPI002A63EEA6|nr:N-acetylneuraminate synthase family protein [Candidatus Methylomirabilis sp.]
MFERLIESAAASGADYIKMQSIFSDDLTKRERFEEGETAPDGMTKTIKRPYSAEKARLSKLDLTMDDHVWFIDKCKEVGAIPLTTIFARHRIAVVGALPWPERVVKVASYDCASWPMLRELAGYFDRFLISTGAMHDDEIRTTAALMKELGKEFSFLHCVTSYPNTLDMCHLARMSWLRTFTPEVGWSDHTLVERDGVTAAKVAIMLGADVVERHITVSAKDDTKDGPVSITPAQLKDLDEFRRLPREIQKETIERETPNWRSLLGEAQRPLGQVELLNRDYYRGRFASPDGKGGWIYNWEDRSLP